MSDVVTHCVTWGSRDSSDGMCACMVTLGTEDAFKYIALYDGPVFL